MASHASQRRVAHSVAALIDFGEVVRILDVADGFSDGAVQDRCRAAEGDGLVCRSVSS